jgi:hypothetical protein
MTPATRHSLNDFVRRIGGHVLGPSAVVELFSIAEAQHNELSIDAAVRVDAAVMQTVPTALEMHTAYEKALKKDE